MLFLEIIVETILPVFLWLLVIIFPTGILFVYQNIMIQKVCTLASISNQDISGILAAWNWSSFTSEEIFITCYPECGTALPCAVIILPSDPEGNICVMNISMHCYKYEVTFCTVSHFGCCWSQSIKFRKEIASDQDVYNCSNSDYISSG